MTLHPHSRARAGALAVLLGPGLFALGALATGCGGSSTDSPGPESPSSRAEAPPPRAAESEEEPAPTVASGPDLVLVTIDACRPDHLSAYGYGEPTTPAMEALAAEGILFERAITAVPITLPAHATMLTGALPPHHLVRDDMESSLDPTTRTLAEVLADSGYRTGAFVGSLELAAKYGLDTGFEHYDDELEGEKRFGVDSTSRPAQDVVRRAGEWLGSLGDEPAFLFVNFAEPNPPHEAPEGAAEGFDDPYDAELRAADRALGRLVEVLDSLGRLDEAWILVTSASGEAFGEHGEEGHGYLVHQPTLSIPMVLRPGGGGEARRSSSPVSLIDLYPTFLAAAGVEVEGAPGVDLLELLEHPGPQRSLYAESILPTRYERSPLFALVEDGWKYVLSSEPALYDLGADPTETRNLVDEQPERAEAMASQLEELVTQRGLGDPSPYDFVDEHRILSGFGDRLAEKDADGVLAACDELDARFPGLRATAYWRAQAEIASYTAERNDRAIERLKVFLTEYPVRRKPARAKLEPYSSAACFELGTRLVEEGRGSEAIYPLRDALRVRPRETTGYLALGEAFLQIDRQTQAVRALEQAAEIETTADLENTMGTIYLRGSVFDKALRHYQRAVELDPDSELLNANLARCYMVHERFADAIASYRRSLELEPEQPAVELELAYLLATAADESVQDLQAAVEGIERALRMNLPATPDTLDGIALVYSRAGDYDLAVKFADRAVQLAREQGDEKLAATIFKRYSEYAAKAKGTPPE